MLLDYDKIDDWHTDLTQRISRYLPADFGDLISASEPEYIEDSLNAVLEICDPDTVIDATVAWVSSSTLVCYHGSRLSSEEQSSVIADGLLPLRVATRHNRLTRALSLHPNWDEACARLEGVLESLGPRMAAGKREGQVHLTLSRSGILHCFNHYLSYGAEVDYHAAYMLLGEEGQELLARDGAAVLVKVAVPGELALRGAHPNFSMGDMREHGELPNIVREFLSAWSFRFIKPSFQSASLRTDCGLRFNSAVPSYWIMGIEPVQIEKTGEM